MQLLDTETRPKFCLTGDVENQEGYFYSIRELPDLLRQKVAAVGQVVNHNGDRVGTCFTARVGSEVVLFSAGHCFWDKDNRRLGREVRFASGDTMEVGWDRAIRFPDLLRDRDIFGVSVRPFSWMEPFELSGIPPILGNKHKDYKVVAIGYPCGYLQNFHTVGPVASVGTIVSWDSLKSLINSFTRIEPGNSGSPLLDIHGDVMGIIFKQSKKIWVAEDSYGSVHSFRRLDLIARAVPLYSFLGA